MGSGVDDNEAARRWDERYARPDWVYGSVPNDFVREWGHALPTGGEVVCLAGGQGRNGVWLAERGHPVTVVDLSAVGLEGARRLAHERGVELETVQADLAHFDLGIDRWDGVLSIFAHLPPAIRRDLHRRVVRALRPGGVLLLEAYTPAQLGYGTGGPPVAELLVTLDELRDELSGLEWVHAVELERPVVEGTHHTGLAAVAQLVGRKPA